MEVLLCIAFFATFGTSTHMTFPSPLNSTASPPSTQIPPYYPYLSNFIGYKWSIWDGWIDQCRNDLFPNVSEEALEAPYDRHGRFTYTRDDLTYEVMIEIIADPNALLDDVLTWYDFITQDRLSGDQTPSTRTPETNYTTVKCGQNGPWPRTDLYMFRDEALDMDFIIETVDKPPKQPEPPPTPAVQNIPQKTSTLSTSRPNHQSTMVPTRIRVDSLPRPFWEQSQRGSNRRQSLFEGRPFLGWLCSCFGCRAGVIPRPERMPAFEQSSNPLEGPLSP